MTHQADRMIVSRIYNAPPAVVWKAWTTPKYFMQWWGPKDFTCPTCRIDLRPGGKFFYAMQSPDGQLFYNAGEYHEIVLHQKIVLSMYFADSEGNQVNPESLGIQHESIENAHDTVLFEDLGNGHTRLTFIGNETMQSATESGQLEGMNQILEKFATVLATLTQFE